MTATGTGPQPVLGPEAAAGGPPRGRGWLGRALRIVNEGPRPFYRAAVVSLGVTSAASMAVGALVRPHGPLPGTQRHIIALGMAGLCLSGVLGLASLAARGRFRHVAWLDRVLAPRERAAIWLALAAWLPFLLLVMYYRAKATFPPPARYIYSPFDDKRWQAAAFLLGTVAPAIWLTMAARVLAVGRGQPSTWRAWFTGLFPRAAAADPEQRASGRAVDAPGAAGDRAGPWRSGARRTLLVAAGLATALGLAWYFLGPPWYLSQTNSAISRQEDVWLTGLQAIAKGHLPYIGVAGVPYGPGTQLVTYLLMHHVTSFSIVGFRQAWALQVWAGASVLFAVFFLAFGYARGLAISLLSALVYPTFGLIAFRSSGAYGGYFGWANPLRYAGMIALVLLLPAVIRRSPSWRGAASGAAVGLLWGLTSYLAQENLAGGAVGVLVVGVLLLFSGSASWRAVWTALTAVLAGFLLVWVPVLAYYAAHDQLGEFLSMYFLFPRAVAAGINDTPWLVPKRVPSAFTLMYHVLPLVLAVLALLTVVQVRPVRIAAGWSRERVRLVVTVVATILLYQGVLFRSDFSHLAGGTLLMVPALVIVTGAVLPRLLGAQRRVTAAIAGVALVAASFAALPAQKYTWASVRSAAELPYLARQQLAAAPHSGMPATLAGRRAGPGLISATQCCQGSAVSMGRFTHLMERIHVLVGDRTAYVANFHGAYPGLVYFMADLNPASISTFEYDGSTLTRSQMKAYLTDFRISGLPQIQALLTYDLKGPEARYFLQRYPNARQIKLHYAKEDYFVLLR